MRLLATTSLIVSLLCICMFSLVAMAGEMCEQCQYGNAKLLHAWNTLEYDWENNEQRASYITNGKFIPENNCMAGIKVWKNDIYVTVPRWRPGVPSTLNKVVQNASGMAVLQPYPSWEFQTVGNPSALQYVQSMEIDSRGWMWILDVGRLNLLADPSTQTFLAPKLVIWDIEANCSVRTFVFPDSVMPWNNSFANDIVVDETNGFAYISNTWDVGGIFVYDFNRNQARRFNDVTLQGDPNNVEVINNISYALASPSDGIALSHDTTTLYYCDLSRVQLWSVPTALLQNFSLPSSQISPSVVEIGAKGYSDGLATSADGRLFYGRSEQSAVYGWDTSQPLQTAVMYVSDNDTMQWPDTFAFDGVGNLLFVSNKLQLFIAGTMTFGANEDPNFRIWSVPVNAKSYLTGNPVPPLMPCELIEK